MAETADKNIVDKDEYPRTAELERRCIAILADLWNAPDPAPRSGVPRPAPARRACWPGWRSSGAGCTATPTGTPPGPGPTWSWASTSRCAGRSSATSGRSRRGWSRWRATGSTSAPTRPWRCATRTPSASSPSWARRWTAATSRSAEICAALDALEARTGCHVPVHVDGASGGMVAPFLDPDLEWDFRLPRVTSINTSGHKYGLVYPGVGWALWRDQEALPEELVERVNYLGGDMPTFALNFSRPGLPGDRAVLHVPAARPRGLPHGPAELPGRRDASGRADRGDGLLPPAHPWRRAPRLRLHHQRRRQRVRRVRRLPAAARVGLAGPGVHLPGRTARTWRCSGSSSATDSASTWPTGWSRT